MKVVALVPIGSLEGAKSRLGMALDPEERRDLVLRLMARTIDATLATDSIAATIVVSPDPAALLEAEQLGASVVRQIGSGLNEGVREARDVALAGGASAVLVIPGDLPLITPDELDRVVRAGTDAMAPDGAKLVVVLVTDRHGRGTNALFVSPPVTIDPCFGGDSAAAHRAQAMAAGARLVDLESPLSLDLDTTDDLLLVEELAPQALRAT